VWPAARPTAIAAVIAILEADRASAVSWIAPLLAIHDMAKVKLGRRLAHYLSGRLDKGEGTSVAIERSSVITDAADTPICTHPPTTV
jgi:hypothetical protein